MNLVISGDGSFSYVRPLLPKAPVLAFAGLAYRASAQRAIGPDGGFKRHGRPIRAFGVTYHDAFVGTFFAA